jgi:hypothetical protein
MSLNSIEQAKSRIISINWKYNDPAKEGSHRLLFKEFLRRTALVAELVGLLDIRGSGWPMLDYAAYFDADLELEDKEIEAFAGELHVNSFPYWYSERVCVYFMHWMAVEDHPEVINHNLLNPYEPLIILYERGGNFRRDKDGTWEFSSTAFFIGSSSSHLSSTPVVELDEGSLNQADKDFEVLCQPIL